MVKENKKSANRGKSQEEKLKKEIKEMCQIVAKTSNALCRRKQQRKTTKKGKEIIKELRVLIDIDTTNYNLRNSRGQWLNKLSYKNINVKKLEE